MRLLQLLETSGSALTTERLRLDLIANNLANLNTTRTADGGPYRRQVAVVAPRESGSPFASLMARVSGRQAEGGGVEVRSVVEDPSPFPRRYDPGHPDAGPDGYVTMPNVDLVTEMVDMMSAVRAYEANVAVMNAAKAMAQRAIGIGRG